MFSGKTKILKKTAITESVWELELARPTDFIYHAGQYVWVILSKAVFADDSGQRRAFSLVSAPGETTLKIIFRDSQKGFKKGLLSLAEGDSLELAGPFGALSFPKNDKTPVVCVVGGTGVAPIISLLKSQFDQPEKRQITLIYANHEGSGVPYEAFLKDASVKHPNFKLILVSGRVDRATLEQTNRESPQAAWMVIGSSAFVYDLSQNIFTLGIEEERMLFDEFHWSKDHEKTEASLSDIQNKPYIFALAAEQAFNHIVITNPEGVIVFANRAAQQITGYTFAEMREHTPRLWGGTHSQGFYQEMWRTIKVEKKPFFGEVINRRKSGELYHALAHISPILDEQKALLGFIGTEEDISARIRAENELLEKTALLEQDRTRDESILASIGDGLIITDNQGKILQMNKVAEELIGISQWDLVNKPFSSIALLDENGAQIPPEKRLMTKALKQKERVTQDVTYKHPTRGSISLGVTATAAVLGEEVIGGVQVLRDITKEKEIDRMKTDFISLASHQLRTPLSAIKWFAQMLLTGDVGTLSPEQKELVDNVAQSNERMIDLVNSLLNISRIESGRIIIDPIPTKMGEFVAGVLSQAKVITDKKKQTLNVKLPSDLPLVNLDPKLAREVCLNLLSNASKYTKEGGVISLSIERQGEDLVTKITDTGYGILPEDKERIFSKFFRGGNVVKIETEGTGLGLYLVKKIIEALGGKIGFDSEVGKGTTFWFTIPIKGVNKQEGVVELTPSNIK